MKSISLALVALTAVALSGVAAGGFGRVVPLTSPAPKRPQPQAAVSDPAEPALKVETSLAGAGLSVASSARGTVLKLNTPGGWQGTAGLTFKDGPPPMRLTLTLVKMPSYDLESLTLVSGKLSLSVGPVSAAGTTKYYDARGRALKAPEGAAYTVTARRWDGELDVEVKRAPGAAMGQALTVSWKSSLNYGGGFGGRW
jgi:hypothetical protein